MKIKTKKVYYCDFCKKHSLRTLAEHEKHCTWNPDRECRLCENWDTKKIIEKYKNSEIIKVIDGIYPEYNFNKEIFEQLKEEAGGCPNCIQTVLNCIIPKECRYIVFSKNWDYKKELENWWKENSHQGEDYY